MAIITRRLDAFGRPVVPSPTIPNIGSNVGVDEMMPDPMSDYDVNKRMSELYQPEMEATERLSQLINSYPHREKPGKLRQIGSVMAKLSAVGHPERRQEANAMSDRMLYEPFLEQLSDWKNQIEPAVSAASNERQANVNSRMYANQIISQEIADRRLERQVKRDRTLETQGDQKIKIAEDRARVQEELGRERLKIAKAIARGGTYQVNKLSGKAQMVFKDGSFIDINDAILPQEDLLELNQNYALERIQTGAEARQTNQRDRVTKEFRINPTTGRVELGTYNMDTNVFTPATTAGDNKQPVEPGVRGTDEITKKRDALALQIKLTNPRLASYISMDMKTRKLVGLQPPNRWLPGGISKEEFDQLARALYGDDAPNILGPKQSSNTVNAQPTTPRTQLGSKREDGKVYVKRKADGAFGWVTNPDPAKYDVK
jgi:hypothetical protein